METFRSCNEDDEIECMLCFDCGWILNDPDSMPFSAIDFDLLLPGDEIIRCWECNQLPDLKTIH